MANSTNRIYGAKAPKSTKCVGLGAARAARAAGFEAEHTHPAEQARFAPLVFPMRQARGNLGVTGTCSFASGAQFAGALVNYFQDALVNENSCSFGAELAAKR